MRLLPRGPVVTVPLFFTRQFLYGSILFVSVFLVLLPASVFTYLSFYKSMIPSERISVPIKFTQLPDSPKRTTVVSGASVLPFVRDHLDLRYSIRFNLHAVCLVEKLFQMLQYEFQLPPYSTGDDILVNCDSRYIYVAKNSWIPYNLRYWSPPILVDILKFVNVEETLISIEGAELLMLLDGNLPIFTFIDPRAILINTKKSSVDFVIEWDGIRYYLVHFYWTSLFIGAGAIWLTSSWFCVVCALASLVYFSQEKEEIVKAEEKRAHKRVINENM